MLYRISQRIVRTWQSEQIIPSESSEAYVYGVQLLLSTLVNIFCIAVVSVLAALPLAWIPFLVGFVPLRVSAGGFHAKTPLRCFITFCGTYLIFIALVLHLHDAGIRLAIHTRGHSRVDDTGIQYQVGDYTLTRTMPEQLRILFNLAVFSGLRKGEMLALQWSDIDFENSTVSVTKAAAVVDGKQVCKAPKTKNSRREVSIPRFLTDRLHYMMVEQTKTKESLSAYWKGNNWLFTQSDGSMMSYSTPYATFQDAIDRYNADKEPADQLPHIPFHGLRHTSATLLIAAHQDVRTVSNRLGHAQASTTMNIYAHALKENDRTASNALENMLCKTGA